MTSIKKNDFNIIDFDFNQKDIDLKINTSNYSHYIKDLWPIVYLIYDIKSKKAYVGETTNAENRMKSHLSDDIKNKLSKLKFIISNKFNKSAALDIESKLISYLTADDQFKLVNLNLGIANHNYYEKNTLYLSIFREIWDTLRSKGLVKHSLEQLNNSDLFKYSPYKSLDRGQLSAINQILDSYLDKNIKTTIINGGAGTGKSIIAIYLFKLLNSNLADLEFNEFDEGIKKQIFLKIKKIKKEKNKLGMGLVVPMSSFRKTLQKVFSKIDGLRSTMVIGPAEVVNKNYDLLLVDEAHRLRKRTNLGAYYGTFDKVNLKLNLDKLKSNELDWVQLKSNNLILFYDSSQSIKPSDVNKKDFDELIEKDTTKYFPLYSQFRVRGGEDYSRFITKLLKVELEEEEKFKHENYDFFIFDSFESFQKEIQKRNSEYTLSRMIAGYSWPWISKNDDNLFDIEIENIKLKWNRKNIDWINSENSVKEVGCIHTTQGYDLNYSGIIFGDEIGFDPIKQEVIINKDKYYDKNGKNSIKTISDLKGYIINIYKTLMLRGVRGTYIYIRDKNLREYFKKHIPKFESEINEVKICENEGSCEYSLPLYEGNFSKKGFISYPNNDELFFNRESLFTLNNNLLINNYNSNVIPNNSICLFSNMEYTNLDGILVLVEENNKLSIYEFQTLNKKKYLTGENIKIEFNKDKHKLKGIFKKVLGIGREVKNKEYLISESLIQNNLIVAEEKTEYKRSKK